MDKEFLKKLGKEAAAAYNAGTPLNDAVAKLAQERSLNASQIARVCEAANLSVYAEKMASADTRRDEFDLADPAAVLSSLKIAPEPKPVKSAAVRDIDYFVKSASINKSSVFAPEYDIDGSFLHKLAEPKFDAESLKINAPKADDAFKKHAAYLEATKAADARMRLKQAMQDLNADLTVAKIKLADGVTEALRLIKQSAMSSNPFLLWRSFDADEVKSDTADMIFTKAAEDISSFNPKLAAELLLEAKRSIPEHSSYIKDRKVKIIFKDPIVKTIDHVTNYRKIIDKIEKYKSCDGINVPSSTPTGSVAHKTGPEQSLLSYYKKLIGEEL